MDWLIKFKFNKQGASLVELVVAIGVFTIIAVSLYGLFSSGIKTVQDNQSRVTALAVANEELEIIKNLPYDDIGTDGGIPAGSIPQTEIREVNNVDFTISTDIRYVDDSFDGVLPTDLLNTDYKQVRIDVNWENQISSTPVTLITNIVPDGLEDNDTGGTLWIEVYDPSLESIPAVSNATVTIEAPDVSPAVSITSLTDADGRYILPGVPEGIEAYQITITKSGYGTEYTYATDLVDNPNPDPAHLNILVGQVTTEYFQLSRLVTTFTVHFEVIDTGTPVSTNFILRGAKTIGTDGEGFPIYKYSESLTSNGAGDRQESDLEYDTYDIIYDEETEGYVIAGFTPQYPYVALPQSTDTLTIYLSPYEEYTALLTVMDPENNVLENADIHMYTDDLVYDEDFISTSYGQKFINSLTPQTYNLEVLLDGYDPYTDTIDINGNESQTIVLAPTL